MERRDAKSPDGNPIVEYDDSTPGLVIIRDTVGNTWCRDSTASYPPNRCWRLINPPWGDPEDGMFVRDW